MPYLKFLYLVLRGEAVACDETGGDSHMLADFAVGGQRFGKHKHRGFRKLVLANVVRRQCGRRVFCDLLIVDADHFDISRHHHIFGGKCLQHANGRFPQ